MTPTFDYSKAADTAKRLIKRFGQPAKLMEFEQSGPNYDPKQEEIQHSVQIVVMAYDIKTIDGTKILHGDKRAFLSTENVEAAPAPANKIDIGNWRFSIVSVSPLSPSGVDVFYELQLRA